jgi:hypothetical protein
MAENSTGVTIDQESAGEAEFAKRIPLEIGAPLRF